VAVIVRAAAALALLQHRSLCHCFGTAGAEAMTEQTRRLAMKRYLVLIPLLALAVGIGVWLGGRSRVPTVYETERSSMRIELARALLPYRLAFRIALGALLLLTLGGLGWGTVRWLHRRVDTVYPDDAGLYPIRERRVGRARVFHDPNRAPSATTIYAIDPSGLRVEHTLPEGGMYVQGQITGQAQAAQAIRAAVSGGGSVPVGAGFSAGTFAGRRVSRPLPEVVPLNLEPSHVERLLIAPEGGDDAG